MIEFFGFNVLTLGIGPFRDDKKQVNFVGPLQLFRLFSFLTFNFFNFFNFLLVNLSKYGRYYTELFSLLKVSKPDEPNLRNLIKGVFWDQNVAMILKLPQFVYSKRINKILRLQLIL